MNVTAPTVPGVPLMVDETQLASLFTEERLLELLVAVRGSTIPAEEKIHLRDLILEFSQLQDETKKAIVQKQILEQITPYARDFAFLFKTENSPPPTAKEPVKSTEPAAVPAAGQIGASRPAPEFSPAPEPVVRKLTPTTDATPASEVTAEPTVKPEIKPAETTPAPTPEVKDVSTANDPASVPEPAPAADPQKRIQEIKGLVNSKVGNPVNLIDADNTIGREYMDALLDAMKKMSGGEGDITTAMARLETAYQAVEKLLSGQPVPMSAPRTPAPNIPTEPATTAAPAGEQVPEPPVAPSTPPNTPPAPEPTPTVTTPPAEKTPPPIPPQTASVAVKVEQRKEPDPISALRPAPAPPNIAPASPKQSAPVKAEEKTMPEPAASKPVTPPVVNNAASAVKEGLYEQPKEKVSESKEPDKRSALQRLTSRLLSGHKTSTPPTAAKKPTGPIPPKAPPAPVANSDIIPPEQPAKLSSVATVETLPEKMETLKKVVDSKAEVTTEQLGNDLTDPKVTDGLEQLLSEWKLFKSSGLLGTGPHGIDHPLYKQLANLPMAAVVSGRFEGVTPEIKQSLTDYMNGWRYEQNIIHEMNETFEQYLRRVILSILKRQNSPAEA